jgi:hypothetical protein
MNVTSCVRGARSSLGISLLCLMNLTAYAAPPASFFRPGVPDFEQRDPAFPNGGNNHCAPTAAANSFTWFDNNGFDIVPDAWKDTPTMPNNHNGLIGQLANDVQPNGATGTTRDNYVKGLRKYLRGLSNQSGHQFDVKFQGSGYNGYTVGSHGATATLDFLKNELATDEDVMLHIGWYTETAPGVLGPRGGGHVVTLDGYTMGNDLLIRDPFYAEGIVEPDASFPAGDLIYEYSTTGNPNQRAKIEAITTVSPKPILFDGILNPSQYQLAGINTSPTLELVALSTFSDYVSFGLDHISLPNQPILPSNPAEITIINQGTQLGYQLTYDTTNGITGVLTGAQTMSGFVGTTFDNTDLWFQLESAFASSGAESIPHPQAELHIDREVFGTFSAPSFFDVFVELDLGTDNFGFSLNPQSLLPNPTDFVTDPDPLFPYPSEGSIGDEFIRRQLAIESIIPEPTSMALLIGMGITIGCVRRRG